MPANKKFVISIPVKPYTYWFIEKNFGDPADFTNHDDHMKFLTGLLEKPDASYDNTHYRQLHNYTSEIQVYIGDSEFYHYGWELSRTNIVKFQRRFELLAKLYMRTFIGVFNGLGFPINTSINKVRSSFGISEDDWKTDNIKKDFYRNGHKVQIDFEDEISRKISNLLLQNLSDLGTISSNLISHHENINKKR